jgi:hypothetical protein
MPEVGLKWLRCAKVRREVTKMCLVAKVYPE